VTTISIGYTILLHIELYHIFPILVIAPFLCLCAIVHFIIQSGKANAKKRLAQLLPLQSSSSSVVAENKLQHNNNLVTRRQSVVKGINVVKKLKQARLEDCQEEGKLCDDDSDELSVGLDDMIKRMVDLDTDNYEFSIPSPEVSCNDEEVSFHDDELAEFENYCANKICEDDINAFEISDDASDSFEIADNWIDKLSYDNKSTNGFSS